MKCNKILMIFFLIVLLAAQTASSGAPIFSNGNFESFSEGKPSHWFIHGNVVRIEGEYPRGKYCMLMKSGLEERSGRSAQKEEKEKAAYLGLPSVEYAPNQAYEISFYAKGIVDGLPISLILTAKKKGEPPVYISKQFILTREWAKYIYNYNFPEKIWADKNCNLTIIVSYSGAYIAEVTAVKQDKAVDEKKPSGISWTEERKNILINAGFELKWGGWGMDLCSDNEPGPSVEFDSKVIHSDGYSLKMPAHNGISSMRYNMDPDQTYTLSFYARSDDTAKYENINDCASVLALHPTWQNKKITINQFGKNWQRYSITFKGKEIQGKPRQMKTCPPYEMNSMYIKITTKKAAAWFDSFQLEKGVLTEYRPEIDISAEATVKNSMYLQNKKAEAVIHIQHQGGIKKKLLLSWIINTVYGNVLQKKEIILDLTKKDTSSMKTEIPSGIQGVMNMVIILTDENKNFISQSKWRYFVIDSFDKFQNPMLGYQNDGIDQWPLWLINTRAEILSFLGIGYTKIALFMLSHSDASKSYDTAIKNITKINKDYGLEVMAHIDFPAGHNLNAYTYRKKEKFEEPSVDEDKAYAEFFGKHFLENNKKYSGYIDKWYIFGEPNLYRDQNGKSIMPPERAAGIYKAVYEQAAKSGEKVFIGGSMNGSDFTYLDKLFQNNAGKYMDRMNYHSYRVSPESPFLYGDIIKMREIINRYNKNIGLVNGEQYYGIRDEYTTWGEFGAHYFADDEADHAGRMVQNFLHHLAAGIQMCYFNCKGTIFQIGRSDPVHYYYAYSGLRAASKFLNGVKKGVYFEAHKSLRTFIFEKPDGIRLVTVNTREFGKNGAMELPACSSHACDFNGNRLETRNLSLSWLPSYIFFKKNIPAEEIIAELRNIKYKGLEIPIQIAYDISEDKDKITMTLSNPYGSPVPGKLYFKSVPAGWSGFNDIKFDLKANSTLDCSFNVPQSDFKWKNDIRIDYALECGDIIEDQSARFPTIFAKKIKNLKIDADLADWNGAEWMSLGEDTMLLTELTEKSLKRVYKGRNDFTGDIAVSWDENSFFIALKAHDDEIVFNGIPGIFWQSDSFQLYFDQQNNAKKGKNYDSDDAVYQIGLDQNGKPVAWLEKNPTGRYIGDANLSTGIDGDITCAYKKTADGYIFETAFSGSALPHMNFKTGTIFGFSITIHDKDGDDRQKAFTPGTVKESNYRNPYVWKGVMLVE